MKSTENFIVNKLTGDSKKILTKINQYILKSPGSSIYHMPEWCDIAEKIFGKTYSYYYAKNSLGEICGVLPLVNMKSRLFGNYYVSMPYFNYGSAVADVDDVKRTLIKTAISDVKSSTSAAHIEFRDHEKWLDDIPVRTDKVTMLLDLPDTISQLQKGFGSKIRAQIKRPIREGVYHKIGGIELLNDFYAVFSRNMRDLGTPVYPECFFSEILNRFPDNAYIVVVYIQNVAVAACYLVKYREMMEIPWASTVREYNRYGVNMYMYSIVLEFAIEQKCKNFDFGRSSKGSGTYRFKKQWGAKEKQLYWYYWLRNDREIPILNHKNKKYKILIEAWKRLPVSVANSIGPHIIKHLP